MKIGINKVTIVGHVGDNLQLNSTNGNGKYTKFSVATNEYYKDKEGKEIQRTEWHRVLAWEKRAEILKEYVKKGDPIYIEGKLRTSSWEDKEGTKKYFTEIICDNFLLLSAKN